MHQEGMCVNHTLITLDVLLRKALSGFKQSILSLVLGEECNTATIREICLKRGRSLSGPGSFVPPVTQIFHHHQHTCKAPEH